MVDQPMGGPTFELAGMSYTKGYAVGRSMIERVWEVVASPVGNKGLGAETDYLLAGVMWSQLMHKQRDSCERPGLDLSMAGLIPLRQKLGAHQLPLS